MATASVTVEANAGRGTREFVAVAIDVLEAAGIHYELTGMTTNIEGDVGRICDALTKIHARCHELGAPRVVSYLKIDDRVDVAQTLASKVLHVDEFRKARANASGDVGVTS